MNQDNNFNTQGYNNFTNNQPNTNMNNNFYQPPINNQVPKKKNNIGLIVGIAVVAVVAVVGVFLGIKLLSNNASNNSNAGSSNNEKVDVVYYDNSRELKDSYTFKEAVSKFAFKVNDTTLIFQENDKVKLEMIQSEKTLHDELMNPQFNYKQDIYTSLGAMYLGESNSTTLEQFKNNFNSGILSDKTKWTIENVKIIEETDEYIFATWMNKGFTTTNEYYFAKQIGGKIFYVYHSSTVTYNDTKISLLLDEFKSFFSCLSEDDGKEAYLYDKIINVPVVLNKQIKDVNKISAVINVITHDYISGSVSFVSDNSDFVNLQYDASKRYDEIEWSKTFDSKTKFIKEDDKNIIGIKDGNNTQVFEITLYSDKQINNEKDFNSHINTYLTNK